MTGPHHLDERKKTALATTDVDAPASGSGPAEATAQPALRGLATKKPISLDPGFEDEVFDIEAEKRRAKLADAAGGTIGAADPRRAVISKNLMQTGRVGPSTTTAADRAQLAASKPVTGSAHEHLDGGFLAARKDRGPGHDPEKALADTRDEVTARAATMAKVLAAAKKVADTPGTEDLRSPDYADYVAATEAGKWADAAAALDRIDVASKAAMAEVAVQVETVAALAPKVNAPKMANHKPTDVKTRAQALAAARANKEWLTVARDVTAFVRLLRQAIDIDERIETVRSEGAALKQKAHQDNITKYLGIHEKMSWDEVVKTMNSSNTEGSLAYLEGKIKTYRTRTSDSEAAELRQAEAVKAGLVASNGSRIQKKVVADFGGAEKTAIEAALKAYDDGKMPALTHSNGMKWGDVFGNHDGDLPAANYKEYYVQKATGSSTYHGNRRLVIDSKNERVYYSWTHYGDNGDPPFVLLRSPEPKTGSGT